MDWVRPSHGATVRNRRRIQRGGGIFINATEMYLRTILVMSEEPDGAPCAEHLALRLGIAPPSVREQLKRLVSEALVEFDGMRHLGLTEEGRRRATSVIRKHCLAERFMVDVIGLDWELAHVESMRWQHVISDRVARRLVAVLEDPPLSPYGDPIPADDRSPEALPLRTDDVRLDTLLERGPCRVRITRILEPLQADERILLALRTIGVTPDAVVDVRNSEENPHAFDVRHLQSGASSLPLAHARWVCAVPVP